MYKLEDNRLRSAKTSDWLNGTPISNFPVYLQELPVEDRQALGWYTHVDYSTELTEATVDPMNDVIHMPAPKFDPHFEISRLRLKRALAEAGLWSQVKAYIESDEDTSDDFWLASVLRTDDPVMVGAVAALKLLTGYTDEQVQSLLEAARV